MVWISYTPVVKEGFMRPQDILAHVFPKDPEKLLSNYTGIQNTDIIG